MPKHEVAKESFHALDILGIFLMIAKIRIKTQNNDAVWATNHLPKLEQQEHGTLWIFERNSFPYPLDANNPTCEYASY